MARMKYHIWTVGCQMNVADSRKLAAGLDRAGWHAVDAPDDADLVVLNTCSCASTRRTAPSASSAA